MIHEERENKKNVKLYLENVNLLASTHPAITCSKLTIQALEQEVKQVLASLLLTLNIFHTLF